MTPKEINFQRTQGDTDPVTIELKTQNGGIITSVPSSAVVKLYLKLGSLVVITGSSTTNGIFSFDMTAANTANVNACAYEVEVNSTTKYVIGTGNIIFNKRLS